MVRVTFRSDNSRSARASHAEERARLLVQEVLDRDERLRSNLSSPDVDPWEHRFIADDSIVEGPIASWREDASRARRLLRRYDIQAGYREKMRDMERRIDAMLHLAESLEESWDAAAAGPGSAPALRTPTQRPMPRPTRRTGHARGRG